MKRIMVIICLLIGMAGLTFAGNDAAYLQNKFKDYFSKMLLKVQNENNIEKKREIINESLVKIDNLLIKVSKMDGVNQNDIAGINKLRNNFQDKRDELNGTNSFQKVKDTELNNFASYILQDSEQAEPYLYISLTALLLIAILLILIL